MHKMASFIAKPKKRKMCFCKLQQKKGVVNRIQGMCRNYDVTVLLILTYSELVKPLLKRQLLVLIHNLRIQKWFESCRISLRRKVREWNSSD